MPEEEVVLISGVRTAVGKVGRAFKEVPAQQLGAVVIKEAVKRAGIQMQHVEEVIMENVISAGLGQNPARQAAALVVASARKARELGIKPLAKIIDYATGGTKPEDIMEAPIPTVKKLLGKTGFTINDIDLIEYNEPYASASIAVSRDLEIDPKKLNVNGGAIALGHPIGCSGARRLVTLVHALKERGLKRGLATLCMGGGNALAMIIERC